MVILVVLIVAWISYAVYAYKYFNGHKFGKIKKNVSAYAKECNDLNGHLREFRNTESKIRTIDQGSAELSDNSEYNYQRTDWSKSTDSRLVYECSATICKNAMNEPYKYLCKYFNIKPTEEALENFEAMLNNFEAADQGKIFLAKQKQDAIDKIIDEVAPLIRIFSSKRLERELGFEPVENTYHRTPIYTFQYVSAGGKSSFSTDIKLNTNNLERFIGYLGDKVEFRKSFAGQRSLMTRALRTTIKERDSYTCQGCGNSSKKEPNLLLEIDHIVPISKGGITSEENLQILCWKCNRSKGSKVITTSNIVPAIQAKKTSKLKIALTHVEMYEQARQLNLAGKKSEARKILEEIIELHPDSETAKIAKTLISWT